MLITSSETTSGPRYDDAGRLLKPLVVQHVPLSQHHVVICIWGFGLDLDRVWKVLPSVGYA